MNPKLTTIRQPIPLLAKYALEMLKNRMINPKIKEQIRTVDVELIIRDSCKKR